MIPTVQWTIIVYRLAAVINCCNFLFLSDLGVRSTLYWLLWHFWSSYGIHSANHCYSYCYNSFPVKSLTSNQSRLVVQFLIWECHVRCPEQYEKIKANLSGCRGIYNRPTGRDLLGSIMSSCLVEHINTKASRCITFVHSLFPSGAVLKILSSQHVYRNLNYNVLFLQMVELKFFFIGTWEAFKTT